MQDSEYYSETEYCSETSEAYHVSYTASCRIGKIGIACVSTTPEGAEQALIKLAGLFGEDYAPSEKEEF